MCTLLSRLIIPNLSLLRDVPWEDPRMVWQTQLFTRLNVKLCGQTNKERKNPIKYLISFFTNANKGVCGWLVLALSMSSTAMQLAIRCRRKRRKLREVWFFMIAFINTIPLRIMNELWYEESSFKIEDTWKSWRTIAFCLLPIDKLDTTGCIFVTNQLATFNTFARAQL